MKAFIEYSEANWSEMKQDPERIAVSLDLLAKAKAAAEPGSVYADRIQRIVEYTKPMENMRTQLSKKRAKEISYRVLIAGQSGGKSMKDNVLDGQLDPEHWPQVRVAPLQPLGPGIAVPPPSKFQILREGDFLYVGIYCQEPDMDALNISTTVSGDAKLLEGDFVTLILETNSHSYYEIAINPAGAIYQIDRGDGGSDKWSSKAEVAVFRGENFWSVEARIPIAGEGARVVDAMVGLDGAKPRQIYPWHFNVGRQRVRGGDIQLSAFSPTGTNDLRIPEALAILWGK